MLVNFLNSHWSTNLVCGVAYLFSGVHFDLAKRKLLTILKSCCYIFFHPLSCQKLRDKCRLKVPLFLFCLCVFEILKAGIMFNSVLHLSLIVTHSIA